MRGSVSDGVALSEPSPAARGLLAGDSPWAEVREVVCAVWGRVLQISITGGWRVELLRDRGFDIGLAWHRGVPVAWRSPVAHDPGPGHTWEGRFLGGLLSTCGTENIGPAHDGLPVHGSHHHTSATDVSADVRWTDGRAWVHATARIESTDLAGRRIVVDREITVRDDTITVEDRVSNAGHRAQNVALLYHVNLGYPLIAPGTEIETDAAATVVGRPENPPVTDPWAIPALDADSAASVFELTSAGEASLSRVRVRNLHAAVVEVEWSPETLPRLNEWMWPRHGVNVLAIEPSNAPLFGPDRDGPLAGSPILEPGGSIRTRVAITSETGVRPADGDES